MQSGLVSWSLLFELFAAHDEPKHTDCLFKPDILVNKGTKEMWVTRCGPVRNLKNNGFQKILFQRTIPTSAPLTGL